VGNHIYLYNTNNNREIIMDLLHHINVYATVLFVMQMATIYVMFSINSTDEKKTGHMKSYLKGDR